MTKTKRAKAVNEYREARTKLEELKKRVSTIGLDYLKDECQKLFDNNPDLIDFGWRQYTPFFNDGDPCTFRCFKGDPMVNGYDSYSDDEPDNPDKYPKLTKEEGKKLRKRVRDFLDGFHEDEFLEWFGDHVKVTVTRKGIETDEYAPY